MMTEHDIEDPVEVMLKKTGCLSLHYKVQVNIVQFCEIEDENLTKINCRSVSPKLKTGVSVRT